MTLDHERLAVYRLARLYGTNRSRFSGTITRFLRSGDLTPVHVPAEQTEAMRDLERAREDAKRAERTARNVLSKFLLRHGCRYAGKSRVWSTSYLDWVRTLHFEFEAQQRVLVSYLHAVEQATERAVQLTNDLAELVETWSLKPLVKALQALRGVQLVTAVTMRPIPILMSRGPNDPIVPFEGGGSTPPNGLNVTIHFLGADKTLATWAELSGCSDMPVMAANGCKMHTQCAAGVEVGLCVGGGHDTGDANRGWDFLKRFSLP